MNTDVLAKLKNAGLLSEQAPNLGFVSTGSYALNKIISGEYSKGIPIGMITQYIGKSSTAKTIFATHTLIDAQKKGYYAVLIDSENAYSAEFAKTVGLDPEKLIYTAPDTIEDCFKTIEDIILAIRESDADTPIVVVYDSLAVSPSKMEFSADNYEGNNMIGAMRAKTTGACLRKMNPMMRSHKVAMIVINQIRNKVGIIYGSNETAAAGGQALEYYLGVNLKCISNKTSDLIKDDLKNVIGIKGSVRNTKNKVSVPFGECEFELLFNKGLNPYYGLLDSFVASGLVTQSGAWFTYNDFKFQKGTFNKDFAKEPRFEGLRKLLDC